MKFSRAALIFICLLMTTPTTYSADKETLKKQSELQKIKPKRTTRDEYNWKLSDDDVDEIV